MSPRSSLVRTLAVLATLAALTFLYRRLFHVNPTTVALSFLVLVLLVATFWKFRVALVSVIASTALFNFFFLPPLGTFSIADPQNWIALLAFLLTAVVASNLAERARHQAEIAQQRRVEVERLYSLSQQLLISENTVHLFNTLPGIVANTFSAQGAAFVLEEVGTIYRSRPDLAFDLETLRRTNLRGEISNMNGVAYLPMRVGLRTAGALAIVGVHLSRETLEAVGSLLGIATERAKAIEELAHTRAAQENDKLRSALLDSVTHEFRTPLTSIKASVTGLLEENSLNAEQTRELLSVIDEEADRLNRLVGEAAEMAQLDAHMFELHQEPCSIDEIISESLQDASALMDSHPTEVNVPTSLPAIRMDKKRICEVLTHLLENAAKYSSPGSPVRVSAESTEREMIVSVSDQGSGIDAMEQTLIFEKFYRGREQRGMAQGTGMGLAISKVIVEAHGGSLQVVSQVGRGSVFSIHLPLSANN
jgi:two-component system, OmpR family, sensor histidine kinase KdpD